MLLCGSLPAPVGASAAISHRHSYSFATHCPSAAHRIRRRDSAGARCRASSQRGAAPGKRAAAQQEQGHAGCTGTRFAESLGASCAAWLCSAPARAAVHAEPVNALSLPTWAIHVSSTVEWGVAMYLVWRYAEVTGNESWKGLTWGMMPLFGGALAACTYHFFYNSPTLDALVALQAGLTFLGNTTCAVAAYRIYKSMQPSTGSQ